MTCAITKQYLFSCIYLSVVVKHQLHHHLLYVYIEYCPIALLFQLHLIVIVF